jgi:hypothetical protein
MCCVLCAAYNCPLFSVSQRRTGYVNLRWPGMKIFRHSSAIWLYLSFEMLAENISLECNCNFEGVIADSHMVYFGRLL